MAGTQLQIEVTGNGDDALAMFQRIATAVESLNAKIKDSVKPPADPATPLDSLENKLNALAKLPGPLGDLFAKLAEAVTGVGTAGTAAGVALDIAFSPITITIGLIAVAVAGLVIGIGLLIDMAAKSVDAFAAWGESVNKIQDLTGMTAEYASTLAFVGEVAGVVPAQIEQMAAAQARMFYAANEALAKLTEATDTARQKASDKDIQLAADHAGKIDAINIDADDKRKNLDAQWNQRQADDARTAGQRDLDYNQKLVDDAAAAKDRLDALAVSHAQKIRDLDAQVSDAKETFAQAEKDRQDSLDKKLTDDAASTADKLNQLAESHAQKVVDLNQSIADNEAQLTEQLNQLAESHAQKVADLNQGIADNETQLTEQLNQLAESHADKVKTLDQSIADLQESYAQRQADRQQALRDQLATIDENRAAGRESLEQRLGGARDKYERAGVQAQLDAFDQQTEAEKAKAEAKAAQQEAKDKAAEDKKLAQIQDRIDKENALYLAQQAKLQEAEAKREAALQDRIAREDALYAAQQAKLQEAEAKREAALQDQVAKANAAYATQTANIQTAYALRVEAAGEAYAKEEQRAQRAEDKKLAALQDGIDRANAAYAVQTARINSDYDKRAKAASDAYEIEEQRAERDENKKLAALQDRVDKEDAAYSIQTAKLQAEQDKRLKTTEASYQRQVDNAQYAFDKQVAAHQKAEAALQDQTQARIDAETVAYNKQVVAVQTSLDDFLKKAADSAPPVVKAIQDLGLSWDAINKMTPDERMNAILTALGKMPDSADKAAEEMKIFGRAGSEVNDLARVYTTETLPAWMEKTKENNKLMSQDSVDAAVKYHEQQNLMQQNWQSITMDIGKNLIPALTTLNTELEKFWKTHGPQVVAILTTLVTTVLPPLIDLMGQLLDLIDRLSGTQGQGAQISALGDVFNNPVMNAMVPGLSDMGLLFQILGGALSSAGRATGGPVTAGQVYNVEETEPEFFVPSQDGAVVPLSKAASAGITRATGQPAGQAPDVTNFYVTINHPHQDDASIMDDIVRLQRLVRY